MLMKAEWHLDFLACGLCCTCSAAACRRKLACASKRTGSQASGSRRHSSLPFTLLNCGLPDLGAEPGMAGDLILLAVHNDDALIADGVEPSEVIARLLGVIGDQ